MNKKIKINKLSKYTEIIMNHSVANILNPLFFNEFAQCLNQVDINEDLIIKGNGRFFSSGLDLFYINNFNRIEMIQFIKKFESLLKSILDHKGKTIAHVNGHTVAGGFILASACDKIYCESGTYKLGMNEKKLGLELPPLAQAIIKFTFADEMDKILCKDDFYKPDEIIKFEPFYENQISFEDINKNHEKLKRINQFMNKEGSKQLDKFLTSWFSKESISARNLALSSLRNPRKES